MEEKEALNRSKLLLTQIYPQLDTLANTTITTTLAEQNDLIADTKAFGWELAKSYHMTRIMYQMTINLEKAFLKTLACVEEFMSLPGREIVVKEAALGTFQEKRQEIIVRALSMMNRTQKQMETSVRNLLAAQEEGKNVRMPGAASPAENAYSILKTPRDEPPSLTSTRGKVADGLIIFILILTVVTPLFYFAMDYFAF